MKTDTGTAKTEKQSLKNDLNASATGKNFEYNQGLPDEVAAEINQFCYFVSRGKTCACAGVSIQDADQACAIAKAWGLFTHVDTSATNVPPQLYIFKHEAYRKVIDEITKESLPVSKETKQWILGKLFGYSDEAIAEFLTRDRTLSRRTSDKEGACRCHRQEQRVDRRSDSDTSPCPASLRSSAYTSPPATNIADDQGGAQ